MPMSKHSEIEQHIAAVRPALDALRFFTATTRGFRDVEQEKLARFLKEVAEHELKELTLDDIKHWLKNSAGWINTMDYRRGDTREYLKLLQGIPPHLLTRTKDYATFIAASGRMTPAKEAIRMRIEQEFCENPVPVEPPPYDGPEIGIKISFNCESGACTLSDIHSAKP